MAPNFLADEIVPCVVDNETVHTGASYDLVDPHTFRLLYKVSCAGVKEAINAVESAAAAFPAWSRTPALERRAIFQKVAQLIRTRHAELVDIEIKETTSGYALAAHEVSMAADVPEELGALATALRDEVAPSPPGQTAYVTREPYGVVYAMAPWNGPLMLGIRSVANPIMAGNTCVMKTSEYSPKTHVALAQLFMEAGLPAGVLNVIHVDPKDAAAVSQAIISHPSVGKVNFTGSTRVGSLLAETCGRYLKPIMLELGGACPFIVLADADLEHAVNASVFGGLFHSGQICMATNSVIVHESIAAKFVSLLAAHVETLEASPQSPLLRGLYSPCSVKRLNGLIEDALSKGAVIAAGERRFDQNVIQPLVLSAVTKEMPIFKEELFGPVFSVVTFKEEQEVIDLANSLEYGLSSAIYSSDVMKAYSIAKKIQCGAVHINGTTVDDAQTRPHGGFKKSGWGRFNGIEGLREFTQTKIITINELRKFPL